MCTDGTLTDLKLLSFYVIIGEPLLSVHPKSVELVLKINNKLSGYPLKFFSNQLPKHINTFTQIKVK